MTSFSVYRSTKIDYNFEPKLDTAKSRYSTAINEFYLNKW